MSAVVTPLTVRLALSERLLGREPWQRDGIRRLGQVALIHACGVLLMGLGSLAGLVPPRQVGYMLAYFATGWVLFYGLMRSGWSARRADPLLGAPLALFGMSTIVVLYGMMDIARGLALQLICVVLVMHIDRLRMRQRIAMAITIGSVAALMLMLAALAWLTPERIDLRTELFNLALAALLLPIAGFLINEANRVSLRGLQHSDELTAVLAGLRERTLLDEWTELPNQRRMRALIEQEIQRQARTGQPLCLAVLAAERVDASAWAAPGGGPTSMPADPPTLRRIAVLASSALDPADTLAHWSPGRFVLLLPACRLPDAQTIIERLQRSVSEQSWGGPAHAAGVTLSAGSTEHRLTDTLDQTLQRATQALQRAQRGGRNQRATEPKLSGPLPSASAAATVSPSRRTLPLFGAPAAPPPKRPRPVMRVSTQHGLAGTRLGQSWLASAGARLLGSAGDLLLSTDPATRERLRLSLTGSLVYAAWLVLLYAYAGPQHLIEPGFMRWLTVYDLVGMLAFYPLIRSGWSARLSDPLLGVPQILYGCGACAACFATTPALRTEALQVMCFSQLFGMATLTARQTRLIGASAIGLQLLALAWTALADTSTHRLLTDTMLVATSCYVVGCISWQSFRFSARRQQVQAEQGALAQAVDRLRSRQILDPLTGLCERRYLAEQLEAEAARQRRSGHGFCVALIGLDCFVRVQGRYAYAASDSLLDALAQTARATLRQTDLLGRWTAQAFLVLLRDTSSGTEATQALERLRIAVQRLSDAHAEQRITLSCGIADYRADEPIERLLERTASGLHAARASGSNRCVLAD